MFFSVRSIVALLQNGACVSKSYLYLPSGARTNPIHEELGSESCVCFWLCAVSSEVSDAGPFFCHALCGEMQVNQSLDMDVGPWLAGQEILPIGLLHLASSEDYVTVLVVFKWIPFLSSHGSVANCEKVL